MTHNEIVFDTIRPWLDAQGFNKPGRVDELNEACAKFLVSADHAAIFNAVRPWLSNKGFTTERIGALDAACSRFLAANGQSGWFDNPPPTPTAPARSKTIADFIGGFIGTHEGGLSMDPADNGNWTGGHRGRGSLVGSKFGVTSGAVAMYRNVPVSSITKADIANLTKEEAVAIGVKNYYEKPGFDKLPWNRVTLSIVDKGWGSGPGRAVQLLQRMIGAAQGGGIGPETIAKYTAWLGQRTEEKAAQEWAQVRLNFDAQLGQPRFIKGWNNRTRSFLPGTPWWEAWG